MFITCELICEAGAQKFKNNLSESSCLDKLLLYCCSLVLDLFKSQNQKLGTEWIY